MVTVANCRDWSEAQIVKSTLESRGITVFVPDEMSNLDGLIMYFGGFRVQVEDHDAAAARTVLEQFKQTNPSGTEASAVAEKTEGPQRDPEETEVHSSRRCVACDAAIPENASMCPKCGWTQPGS
jgi:hypothetical protein